MITEQQNLYHKCDEKVYWPASHEMTQKMVFASHEMATVSHEMTQTANKIVIVTQ